MATVQLTERAAKEVKQIMQEQEMSPETTYLRVGVAGGGCSGFMYNFNLEEEYDEANDSLHEQDGLKIVVDRKSALYLDGTEVDFHEDLNRRGFVFNNPNAVKSCGCNQSFSC